MTIYKERLFETSLWTNKKTLTPIDHNYEIIMNQNFKILAQILWYFLSMSWNFHYLKLHREKIIAKMARWLILESNQGLFALIPNVMHQIA